MSKKIFMAGTTSYLGSKFTELYGSQFEILGVSRQDANNPIDLLAFDTLKRLFTDFQPDFILHLAADTGRDSTTSDEITKTNPAIVKNLIDLALPSKTPFIFTSTEAVYGGKETTGGYIETDEYKPRSPYGQSKVLSEQALIASSLPYLITRGHRHVGINKAYARPKQFPDALRQLSDGGEVHLDPSKIFTPVLINNVSDIFAHYIENDADKQLIVNMGAERSTTFYDFMSDVATVLGINRDLLKPDGNEAGWPENSSLNTDKIRSLGYPTVTYEQILEVIQADAS